MFFDRIRRAKNDLQRTGRMLFPDERTHHRHTVDTELHGAIRHAGTVAPKLSNPRHVPLHGRNSLSPRRATAPLPTPDLTPISLSLIPGAIDEPSHRAAYRFDPYWFGLTVGGLEASWESRNLAERLTASQSKRSARPPVELREDRTAARERLTRRQPDIAFNTLGAIGMWRTLTTDQVAAIAGWIAPQIGVNDHRGAWSGSPRILQRLWSADLIERGQLVTPRRGLPMLWRPHVSTANDRFIARQDVADSMRMTNGMKWTKAPSGSLHNVLGTELGLRLAELCDVATVLGESVCLMGRLDAAFTSDTRGRATADLAAVRPDGMRICFEVTVHQSRLGIRRKVRRWLDLLATSEFSSTGLTVCFVEAMPPDTTGNEVASALRQEIEAALSERADTAWWRLRERVSIARWRWWFPAAQSVTAGFVPLVAYRPLGRGADLWQPVRLLDPMDMEFTPADPAALEAVVQNSRMLGGVPHWVRGRLIDEYGEFDWDLYALIRTGFLRIVREYPRSPYPPGA